MKQLLQQEILLFVYQQDMAVANGHLVVLKYLQEKSNEIFMKLLNFSNAEENTPLHWAVINQQLDCIKYLTEQKANMNLKNTLGQKPLDIAVEMEYDDAVEALGKQTKIEKEELDKFEQAVEEHEKEHKKQNQKE